MEALQNLKYMLQKGDYMCKLDGDYDKVCIIKCFDFSLSRTLRVIFRLLISGGGGLRPAGAN